MCSRTVSDVVPVLHPNQVHVDERIVRRLVEDQFPEARDLPLRRYPSTGTVNAIYRLGDLAVRLPLLADFAESLRKELEWLPWLGPQLPLVCPAVVAVGEPDEDYPYPWAIYRWIEGSPWSVDEVDEATAGDALAAFILVLQEVDTAGAPTARPGYQGSAVRHRDRAVRAALERTVGVLDTAAVEAAWAATLAAPDWEAEPVWVHGDLLAPNVLVRDRGLHAVLGFGNACVGDPAVDVAAAWSLFGDTARRRFRDALQPDDAIWARARGWALTGIQGIAYYARSNPAFAKDCRRRVQAALDDP